MRLQIDLVSDNAYQNLWQGLLMQFLNPLLTLLKGISIRDIEYYTSSYGVSNEKIIIAWYNPYL
jgi:hypothetical protein